MDVFIVTHVFHGISEVMDWENCHVLADIIFPGTKGFVRMLPHPNNQRRRRKF